MGANNSRLHGKKSHLQLDEKTPLLEAKSRRHHDPTLPELQRFFQDVKRGDELTIGAIESKAWDCIIFYTEWLEQLHSSSPISLEELDLSFQAWKDQLRDAHGSMPKTRRLGFLDATVEKIKIRLEGNDAHKICFRLLNAVADAARDESLPPKFEYKQKSLRAPDTLADTEIKESIEIKEYRAHHEEMTTFFIALEYGHEWSGYNNGKGMLRAILEYLEWMVAPCDDEMLQKIYQFYKHRVVAEYRHCLHSEVVIETAGLLRELLDFEKKQLVVIVRERNGGKHEMDLVDTVYEFLKAGKLSPMARRIASNLQPPSTHKSKAFGPYCEKTIFCVRISYMIEDLDQEVKRLNKFREQISVNPQIVAQPADVEEGLGRRLIRLGQERKVLEEADNALWALLGLGPRKSNATNNLSVILHQLTAAVTDLY